MGPFNGSLKYKGGADLFGSSYNSLTYFNQRHVLSFSSNKIVPSLSLIIPDEFVNFLCFSSLIRLCACLGLNQ